MDIRRTVRTVTRRGKADEAGFTLIELLVVVIVIGILAAIAVPVYLGAQQHTQEAAVISDVVNLKTAVLAQDYTNNAMPGALPSTTTSLSSSWKNAGATWSKFTSNVVYKPGTGASYCAAGLSSTGSVFVTTQANGVAQSTQNSLDAACP